MAFGSRRFQSAPAADRSLEVNKPAVKACLRQGRRQVAYQRGAGAALGDGAFRGVVGGIEIEIRHVADQPVRPALGGEAGLLARHEFKRAMGAEVEDGIGREVLAQVAVEGRESMGRREALLEQQPHRVTFVAKGRLDADQNIAEALAQHMDRRAIGLLAAGGWTPLRLDFVQMRFTPHMLISVNAMHHIGIRAEAFGIALEDTRLKLVDGGGNFDVIAIRFHGGQRVEQRLEHGQEGRRANCTRVWREVEQHDRNLAVVLRCLPQCHLPGDAGGKHCGAFGMHLHAALALVGNRAATEHDTTRRPVEFGDGDHHGGLDRVQSALGVFPFLESLEFDGLCRQIGYVQLDQHVLGGARVIVGGSTHQREAGERHQGINGGLLILHEEALDGGPLVEAGGEGRDHLEATRFEGGDHPVIMRRVA